MARIGIATVGFALWHSFLCSRRAKDGAKKWLGEERGTGYYRAFFMAQSAVTTGALVLFVLFQPHRVLYSAQGWKRWLGWGGQAGSILLAVLALREQDVAKFAGVKGVKALADEEHIPEAEAQGPTIEEDGRVRAQGVFRYSRHALDWAPVLLLLTSPVMKTNWLAFDVLAAIYAVLGAKQEEKRLLLQSPEAYKEYQRQVAFFFGLPKRQKPMAESQEN